MAPISVGPAKKESMKNRACQHFHFWGKFLQILASLTHAVKLLNKSPSYMVQDLFKLLPLCWVLE